MEIEITYPMIISTLRKLNKEKQREILVKSDILSIQELAAEYKCCDQTIRKVLRGTY